MHCWFGLVKKDFKKLRIIIVLVYGSIFIENEAVSGGATTTLFIGKFKCMAYLTNHLDSCT